MQTSLASRIVSLEVPPQRSVLRQVSAWLASQAVAWCIPEEVLARLDLCLNEVLANCVTDGRPEVLVAPLALPLSMASSHDQTLVTLSVADSGVLSTRRP